MRWVLVPEGRDICRTNEPSEFKLRRSDIRAILSKALRNVSEEVAAIAVDTAIKAHKALCPGLLESTYRKCHAHELRKRGLRVETEVIVPIIYDGERIDAGDRIDTLVEDIAAIENKAVGQMLPLHEVQQLT